MSYTSPFTELFFVEQENRILNASYTIPDVTIEEEQWED